VSARVLWVVVDSLPPDCVNDAEMPWLAGLASEGGMAAGGGHAVMPALTYPNLASFVTGAGPTSHGIAANRVFRNGRWRGAEELGPSVPTVFDRLAARGRPAAAVFGDQNLVGVCGALTATTHWPRGGVHVDGTALAGTGYAADSEVLAAAGEMDLPAHALTFVQFDEMDSVSHIHGPRSREAGETVRDVDSGLARLADAYSDVWDETLVVVLSDHLQEATEGEPVPFDEVVASALGVDPPPNPYEGDAAGRWRTEGTVAWISREARSELGDPVRLPGVEGSGLLGDGTAVAWGPEGSLLGLDWGQRGDHGSPRTARQVAVVGGGHPAAGRIGESISRKPPLCTEWADWVMGVL
jgi:hypothetical protein